MYVLTEAVWMESPKGDKSKRRRAVAINIENGNTIYIKEYESQERDIYTVELDIPTGNDNTVEVSIDIILATFEHKKSANLYTVKILNAYERGIRVYREIP